MKVLGDKIILKLNIDRNEDGFATTAGGLIIPKQAERKTAKTGTVIAFGNKCSDIVQIGATAYFNVDGIDVSEQFGTDHIMVFEREIELVI